MLSDNKSTFTDALQLLNEEIISGVSINLFLSRTLQIKSSGIAFGILLYRDVGWVGESHQL